MTKYFWGGLNYLFKRVFCLKSWLWIVSRLQQELSTHSCRFLDWRYVLVPLLFHMAVAPKDCSVNHQCCFPSIERAARTGCETFLSDHARGFSQRLKVQPWDLPLHHSSPFLSAILRPVRHVLYLPNVCCVYINTPAAELGLNHPENRKILPCASCGERRPPPEKRKWKLVSRWPDALVSAPGVK